MNAEVGKCLLIMLSHLLKVVSETSKLTNLSSSLPAGTVFKFNLSDVEMPVEEISISRGCGEQTL